MSEPHDLSERINTLSPEKRALLEKMLQEKRARAAASGDAITPYPGAGPGPLSFAQAQLWFLYRLDPTRRDYNVPAAMRLVGPLNQIALEEALNEIVRRHSTLRTTFHDTKDGPVQKIAPELRLPLKIIDLQNLSPAERESQAQRLIEQTAGQPFVLETGPLLRTLLLRLASQEHLLVIAAHHIACDAVSISIFNRELGAIYEAFLSGKIASLPEVPVRYADYAAWQRRHLTTERMEDLLQFWRTRRLRRTLDPAQAG